MNSSFSHVALLVNSVEASAAFLNSRGIKAEELLLEAISDGPYQRAMKKRGASLHHLAIDVLNVEEFSHQAQKIGWKLPPVSEQTMSHKTAWLFSEGIPTLIEVHQQKELCAKPVKTSKLELPIKKPRTNKSPLA